MRYVESFSAMPVILSGQITMVTDAEQITWFRAGHVQGLLTGLPPH